jgi:HEAT repeat protein
VTDLELSDADRRSVAAIDELLGDGRVEPLIGYLSAPSWSVRRAAVSALAQLGDAAIGSLCDVVRARGADEERLAAAVEALVASSGAADAAVLTLASASDVAVLCDAAQILGRRRCTAALPLLARLAAGGNDNAAFAAIEAIGRIGGRPAVNLLIAAVASGSFFRAFPAIEVLGRTGDPRSVRPLAALLDEPTYAAEAARALGHSGQAAAARALATALATGDEALVRAAACALAELHDRLAEQFGPDLAVPEALAEHDLAGTGRRLAQGLTGADPPERVAICRVLGWVGAPGAVQALLELLSGDRGAASAAATAIETLPAAADPALRVALRQGDTERRLVLLPIIARRRVSADEVLACLEDPEPAVRAAACDALGKIGDGAAVPALFALLDGDASVAQAALVAIQCIGGSETERRALDAARSSAVAVRRAALRVLAYFGWSSALGEFLRALADPDERIREVGALGLTSIDDPRAIEALVAAAAHPSSRTRAAAARALGQTAGPPVVRGCLRAALSDADPWVRYYACQALGRLKDREAVDAIHALTHDPAGHVRLAAIEALASAGGDRALEALSAAADSSDPDLQRVALLGLGAVRSPSSLDRIRRALASDDDATRLVAVSALGELPDGGVVAALAGAMHDRNDSVRGAAATLLGDRGGAAATSALVEALDDETMRDRAIVALSANPAGRIEGLVAALRDATPGRAAHIVSALSRIHGATAQAALEDAFTVDNPGARQAVAPALLARRTPSARVLIERAAASDPDPQVRQVCAALLGG